MTTMTPCIIERCETEGSDAILITIKGMRHETHRMPGQYCFLQNTTGTKLPYAIASAPGETSWQLLLRQSPLLSSLSLLEDKRQNLSISEATGNGFPIQTLQHANILCIAIGTGISAIRPFLLYAARNREDFEEIGVLHGDRNEERMPFVKEHETWRHADIFVKKIFSEKHGYVYENFEKKIKKNTKILLVGSKEMMVLTRLELAKHGIGPTQIFTNF